MILQRTFVQGRMRINRPWHAEALRPIVATSMISVPSVKSHRIDPNSRALTVHILLNANTVRLLDICHSYFG